MPCSASSRSLAALQLLGIADEDRHDMGRARHHRQAGAPQHRFGARGAILVALALPLRRLQMADGGGRGGADRRRQRGGEDEAGRVGAHRVDQRGAAGDVAAEAAERLGERALDHVDAAHGAVALGDAAAARAVHADRVHLVDIGHGAVALGEVADARSTGATSPSIE